MLIILNYISISHAALFLYIYFQVFVETLDKSFKNVCELDLVFHVDKVRFSFVDLV